MSYRWNQVISFCYGDMSLSLSDGTERESLVHGGKFGKNFESYLDANRIRNAMSEVKSTTEKPLSARHIKTTVHFTLICHTMFSDNLFITSYFELRLT